MQDSFGMSQKAKVLTSVGRGESDATNDRLGIASIDHWLNIREGTEETTGYRATSRIKGAKLHILS